MGTTDNTDWKLYPTLMLPLPNEQENEESSRTRTSGFSLFGLVDRKHHEVRYMPGIFTTGRPVGCSHGWLVMLDEQCDPYILHPHYKQLILLPPLDTFPCIFQLCKTMDGSLAAYYKTSRIFGIFGGCGLVSLKHIRESFITKAVLSSDPNANANSRVVVIYGDESRLAFSRIQDKSWTELGSYRHPYIDVICSNGTLFALSDKGFVDVWDMDKNFPVKVMDIKSSLPKKVSEKWFPMRGLLSINMYLVEAAGQLLLVVRFIGEFVNGDGIPIEECDLLTEEDTHPLVCPYRTLEFQVYTLDKSIEEWIDIDSIGDHILFLGGNHSVSLGSQDCMECEGNSIYFTDDYWDRVNEDYMYGGHDMGVYNLKTGSVKQFYQAASVRIEPPPFWIIPLRFFA